MIVKKFLYNRDVDIIYNYERPTGYLYTKSEQIPIYSTSIRKKRKTNNYVQKKGVASYINCDNFLTTTWNKMNTQFGLS